MNETITSRSKLGVFIGRIQPYHQGHAAIVNAAMEQCDKLVFLIGSSFKARSTFNPWTFEERKAMVEMSLKEDVKDRVLILPLADSEYNNDQWKLNVQNVVEEASLYFFGEKSVTTSLIGHAKDQSSFYLKMFPQWGSIEVANYREISATPIRQQYFLANGFTQQVACAVVQGGVLSREIANYLCAFQKQPVFAAMVDEFRFIQAYKEPYKALKYPPVFLTVDVCVVQSGHVLMIRRRAAPGKGLWALPGGFVEETQLIEDAAYAELSQETGLGRKAVGTYQKMKVFDHPFRSARGRTVTHAFLFRLPDSTKKPRARAGDDAEKAKWWPINDITSEMCMEDHFAIIHTLLETKK